MILLGIWLRYAGLGFISIDMKGFLFNWYDEMVLAGFSSLGKAFSNYTPPYLYLLGLAASLSFLPKIVAIKLISILFDLINAVVVYKILELKYPQKIFALLGSAGFLLLPTILLNSAYWGQADAIYTCFLLVCIYFLLTERPLLSMISFGISFSFKAQSIFLLPFLVLYTIKKRTPWFYFGVVPGIYFLMMIPAMAAGRSFWDLITIYLNQVNSYRYLTLSSPNLYVFIPNDLYDISVKIGTLVTVLVIGAWVSIYTRRIKTHSLEVMVICALASVALVPFFLPKMHDRYFYPADILSLLTAFYVSGAWTLALGYQIISGMVYVIFLLFPQMEPFKETILISAAMINTFLMGTLLFMQWNLTSENMRHESFWIKQWNRIVAAFPQVKIYLWFVLIFVVGVIVRVWEFGNLPAGLNPDEASIGVEAYYLFKYGIDRNGMSYPVHLISWGSGQNSLYAYLILPLVAWQGITIMSVRLPMLIAGILSIPLIYFAGRKMLGEKFGLIAMFFMAVSPWHIVNSRWAVESNILPFLFLTGFTLLLHASEKNYWFILSCLFFALSLYAYGTAYVGVPIFMLFVFPVLIYTKQIKVKQAVIGLILFFVLSLPIALFIIVNTFHLDTLHLGLITIPRLPVQARYEAMAAIFSDSPLSSILENIRIMLKLLWSQEDSFPWNYVKPYGYFYKITFPFLLIGVLLTIPLKLNPEKKVERWFLFSWMAASVAIGVVHPTNLTRLNLIFTPVLLCIALFLFELDKRLKYSLAISVLALSIGFVLFTRAYHGDDYRKRTSSLFNLGIIPAIEYATNNSKSSICLTESTYSSYIYVLLSQKMHPSEYINNIEWLYPVDPIDPSRTPRALGRYHFRIPDCKNDLESTYILLIKESPPTENINYRIRRFDKFIVFIPKK